MAVSGNAARVFIVYSKDDKSWMLKVKDYLESLKRSRDLEPWSDVCLEMGYSWEQQIESQLKKADAALLLISPAFLSTDFVQDVEIPELLTRCEQESIPVVPIPVEESNWERYEWLNKLMSYQKAPKPLALLRKAEVNVALKQICNKLIYQLQSGSSAARSLSGAESSLRDRLCVLCVFSRPVCLSGAKTTRFLPYLDLRTEWTKLMAAVLSRNAPVALLRQRPSTRAHLIDTLRVLKRRDAYPHAIHLSALQWSEGVVLQDENGSAEHVSFAELSQDIGSIGQRLPLLVCSALGHLEDSAPTFNALTSSPEIGTVVSTMWDFHADNEASCWANFYGRLAHNETLSDAVDRSFPSTKPDLFGARGSLLTEQLSAGDAFVDEGAPVDTLAAGSLHFVNRCNELRLIAHQIHRQRVTLITGMTGVGKRALALEAAYRNVWRFSGGVAQYIGPQDEKQTDALTATSIINNLAEQLDIDERLGSKTNEKFSPDRRLQLQRLLKENPFLFVLLEMSAFGQRHRDEFQDLIRFFLDHGVRSHCIITTRTDLPAGSLLQTGVINHIKLLPLNSEVTRNLTALIARDFPGTEFIANDEPLSREIAESSGGYPEILETTVRLARSLRVQTMIDQLKNHTGQIAKQMRTLVGSSVDTLDDNGRGVFQCLQLFPAQSISRYSWDAIRNSLKLNEIDEATEALISASLLRFDPKMGRYYWDKTVHDYASHEKIEEEVQREIDKQLLAIYSGDSCSEDNLSEVLSQGESAVNILAVVNRAMNSADVVDAELLSVAYDITKYAQKRGLEFEGRPLLRSVIDICRLSTGTSEQIDRSRAAALLYDIASIEQTQGDYEAAEKHYQTTLKINEDDGNEFGISRSYHGLGRLNHDKGDFLAAREFYEKSLRIRKDGRRRGDERETASTVAQLFHELARLAHDEGNFIEANRLHEKTLSMRMIEPVDDRGIAATKYEMGRLAQDRGDWNLAERFYRESHEYWLRGDYSIGVGIVMHAQASLLVLYKKYNDANEKFTECLEIQRRAGDRRGVAATLAQLGMLAIVEPERNLAVARDNLEQSLKMQRSSNYQHGELVARIGLSLVEYFENKSASAEKSLRKIRNQCVESGHKKLLAKVYLLLGWFKASKIMSGESTPNDQNTALADLYTALETALRIGDRCTEATAKYQIGSLLKSLIGVDANLQHQAADILQKLHGEERWDTDGGCNIIEAVMASLC